MTPFDIWNKDKRRKDEELLNAPFSLRLTKTEIEWIKEQAKEDCTSINSIIRKAIRQYRKRVSSN